jgi:hypothetical protein
MTHEGGCLCGAVRFTVHGRVRHILVCHCHECRRWAGRAYAATAARADELEIRGDVVWRPSPLSEYQAKRGNCARCGSSLFWWADGGERIAISAGCLDDSSALRVVAHIWAEQATAWERPPEEIPAYPRGYPEDAPPLPWS